MQEVPPPRGVSGERGGSGGLASGDVARELQMARSTRGARGGSALPRRATDAVDAVLGHVPVRHHPVVLLQKKN